MANTRSPQFFFVSPEKIKDHICRLFGDGAFSSSAATDRLSTASKASLVERRRLIDLSSLSGNKKEGLAWATLRWIGCAFDAASQAYNPSVSSVRSWSVSNNERLRRKKVKKETSRNHGGGKISCALFTEISVAGRRLPDGSEVRPILALCCSSFWI